jgi:hypothetical protein
MKKYTLSATILTALLCATFCDTLAMTIDPGHKQAKVCKDTSCSTYKLINFLPLGGASPVTLTNGIITGYAWGEELGWIKFNPNGTGVLYNEASGTLSGYAWASASGWINFRPTNAGTISLGVPVGVALLSNGNLYGWAFASGVGGGWILFDCAQIATCVSFTDVTPPQVTPPANSGGYFNPPSPNQPVPPEPPTPQNPPIETPPPLVKPQKPEEPLPQTEKTPEVTPEEPKVLPDVPAEKQTLPVENPAVDQSNSLGKNTQEAHKEAAPTFSASSFFSVLNPFNWFGGSSAKTENTQDESHAVNQSQNSSETSQNGSAGISQENNLTGGVRSWANAVIEKVVGTPRKAGNGIARATYSLYDVFVALVKNLVY